MAEVANLHNNIDRTRNYVLQRENIIGRSPECSIFFDNKRVSRRHARVAKVAGADSYYVEDISTRGVYVNFKRIKGRHPINEGDRICILQFRNVHPLELERMDERGLKECCDDPRNHGIKAIVDLTFGYIDLEEAKPKEEKDKPKGFLERIKALFKGEEEPRPTPPPKKPMKPKKPVKPVKPMKPKEPMKLKEPEKPTTEPQEEKKKKKKEWQSSRPDRYKL